jgi:two-component system chemotaxis sensor kinase CheA
MDDLLREFLTESNENVLRIEQEMVLLEQRPGDKELLGSIFRSLHTIKGTCGFLGLQRLEKVAHAAENVLGGVRDGALAPTRDLVGDVLAAVDVVKDILEGLERGEDDPTGDDEVVIGLLSRWLGGGPSTEPEDFDHLFRAAANTRPAPCEPVVAEERTPSGSPSLPRADSAPEPATALAEQTLRVDVGVLDRLMDLAGELVLVRNQLTQTGRHDRESVVSMPVQQLNRVTSELQDVVMKTRMQPVGHAWATLPRLVRDLCSASGKRIELVLRGAETELDRQVLQAIRDPLTHMVRNSADHGIESTAERRAAGKPELGRIVLDSFHEGGHIVIEIRDDGRGIDVARVRAKVVERGLATAEAVADMPDPRIFSYIFEAGFSTAREVTAVSGRGVGMDVVRRNIQKIGGTVEVTSVSGQGTTFRIRIPLTLAIMSALLVGVRGQSFAIPQIGVLELVRVGAAAGGQVDEVNGVFFLRLRDELLPLVRLDEVLGFVPGDTVTGYVAVCRAGAARFGVLVDAIHDTHEIVVKPAGRMFSGVRPYAGTTILGDGRVVMILDVSGIAQSSEVLSRSQLDHGWMESTAGEATEDAREALLLFDAGSGTPGAVPLSRVARLEEFPLRDIEWADGRWVVQYRDRLLPLVVVGDGSVMNDQDPRQVVVLFDETGAVGLVVDEVLDIVDHSMALESRSVTPGVVGAMVVSGRATDLLDPDHYLRQGRAGRSAGHPPPGRERSRPARTRTRGSAR